jgi:hypothetical protein
VQVYVGAASVHVGFDPYVLRLVTSVAANPAGSVSLIVMALPSVGPPTLIAVSTIRPPLVKFVGSADDTIRQTGGPSADETDAHASDAHKTARQLTASKQHLIKP